MVIDVTKIAKDIRRRRRAIDLSQGQLAKLANVSEDALVRLENGRLPNPTVGTLNRILDGLSRAERGKGGNSTDAAA